MELTVKKVTLAELTVMKLIVVVLTIVEYNVGYSGTVRAKVIVLRLVVRRKARISPSSDGTRMDTQ